jgi:MoaA/NifB/PqqE/SkfB family radical SAM enzyme
MNGVKALSLTGGEPLLFLDEVAGLIDYAGKAGIDYIRTGTNGFMFRNSRQPGFASKVNRIAEKLAGTPLRNLWISIDSAIPSVHEKMRGFSGVIEGIERALPVFHEHGLYPSANLGINRNVGGEVEHHDHPLGEDVSLEGFYEKYRADFRKFYGFVIDLGFTMVNACYPMSVDNSEETGDLKAVYAATSPDNIVRFSLSERAYLFKALLNTIPEFRSRIRIFTPLSSLRALYRQYTDDAYTPYPCRGGIDYFYVDVADGNTYPCGYRGSENLGKFWDMDWKARNSQTDCYQCDWECFRDPSELLGPLIPGLLRPLETLKKMWRDGDSFNLWISDLTYYRACHFFDGRTPPDYQRLKFFSKGY